MIRRLLLAICLALCAMTAVADVLQRGVAVGDQILVHTQPDPVAPTAGSLVEGDAVLVLHRSDERAWLEAEKDYWYLVERDDGLTGWIHGSQLLRGELEAQVVGSGVRMRETPGTTGGFVQSLPVGAWVTVIDRTPEPETIGDTTARWFQVRTGRTTGWVYGQYVQLALTTPASARSPFLGWRCWPGRPDVPHPTESQVLAGLARWRRTVAADIARGLAGAESNSAQQLARGWAAFTEERFADAIAAFEPVTQLPEDEATPLGSAHASAALLRAWAIADSGAPTAEVRAALDAAMVTGHSKLLTGTDWTTPADLAAFDRLLFHLEQETKDVRATRECVETIAGDPDRSPIVRAAGGVALVRLQFAERRETAALQAARQVFALGPDAQLACGPAPVHFGATALTLACDALVAVGGDADAVQLCESVARSTDPSLQAVARMRLARLRDMSTADIDEVLAAYDAVPEFRIRLANLQTLDAGDSAARALNLRARTQVVGASDQAWVTGDRVRLRSTPSTRGAVLASLSQDTVVRLLYPAPEWAAEGDVPWMKVRVRGGQTGWLSEEYLELQAPRVPAMPPATGMLWSQANGGPDGTGVAPGHEIDDPVVLWRVPNVMSGATALGDVNGDGTADLVVTGVMGDRACARGVAVLDGKTQAELWRADTLGCTDARSVAVAAGLVLVASDDRALEAFAVRDGTVRWTWLAQGGRITAPVTDGRFVAVGAADGTLTVLDLRTGQQQLRARLGDAIEVPPVLVGERVYVLTDRTLSAVDISTRQPLWRARLIRGSQRATAAGQQVGGLASVDDRLYGAAPSGVLIACDRMSGDPLWQVDMGGTPVGGPIIGERRVVAALANGELRAWTMAEGTEDWRTRLRGTVVSGLLLADHTLVVGTADGTVSGLSRVDGRLRWELELGAPLDRGPAGGGGRVIIGSAAGPLFVLGDAASAQMTKAAPLRSGPSPISQSD